MDRGSEWVTGSGSGVHPATAATATITRTLDELTDVPLYGLVPEAVGDLLTSVVALEARLAGLRMQLIGAAETAGTAARAGRPGRPRGCAGPAASNGLRPDARYGWRRPWLQNTSARAERCPRDG